MQTDARKIKQIEKVWSYYFSRNKVLNIKGLIYEAFIGGILRDKTIAEKFIYIINASDDE